jgi:hypothetical protein
MELLRVITSDLTFRESLSYFHPRNLGIEDNLGTENDDVTNVKTFDKHKCVMISNKTLELT